MSTRFPGSAVLTQDSAGHCSLAAFSPCTWAAVSRYFDTGELPKPGTVCPIEDPFGTSPPSPAAAAMMHEFAADAEGAAEVARLAAAHEVAARALAEMMVDGAGMGVGVGAFGRKGLKRMVGLGL
jgi:hypothetical protein